MERYYTDPKKLGLSLVKTICIADNGNCGIFDITFSGEQYTTEELQDEFEELEFRLFETKMNSDDEEVHAVYESFDLFYYGASPEKNSNFLVRALLKMPEQKAVLESLSELGWKSTVSNDGKIAIASHLFGDGESYDLQTSESKNWDITSMPFEIKRPAGLGGVTYFSCFDSYETLSVPDNEVILFSVIDRRRAEGFLKHSRISLISCFKNRNSGNHVYSMMLDTTEGPKDG